MTIAVDWDRKNRIKPNQKTKQKSPTKIEKQDPRNATITEWDRRWHQQKATRTQSRVFFGPFWRPIFGRVPNAKKYVFFPIWIRKFPIQGTKKKTGEKITKYRHFTMFMFVVERAGPNSPNDTREITKYCKLPNGNVPLRQFSRIYLRRCRGVCNKHTWFFLLVPYSGVLI